MDAKSSKEPKQRILDAAVSLFVQKGYAAVGVREIASAADVNIAMISYYFEGKAGILKAVVGEFFNRFSQIFKDVVDEGKSPEECVKTLIWNLIDFVRKNTELTLVTYNELPLDIPEINELKAQRISHLIQRMSGLIRRFGLDPADTSLLSMIGPSLMAMVFTNFRIRPVLKRVFNLKFNNVYYERLKETIAILFLKGVHGIAAERQRKIRSRQ